jgi:hypothetical protein
MARQRAYFMRMQVAQATGDVQCDAMAAAVPLQLPGVVVLNCLTQVAACMCATSAVVNMQTLLPGQLHDLAEQARHQ